MEPPATTILSGASASGMGRRRVPEARLNQLRADRTGEQRSAVHNHSRHAGDVQSTRSFDLGANLGYSFIRREQCGNVLGIQSGGGADRKQDLVVTDVTTFVEI